MTRPSRSGSALDGSRFTWLLAGVLFGFWLKLLDRLARNRVRLAHVSDVFLALTAVLLGTVNYISIRDQELRSSAFPFEAVTRTLGVALPIALSRQPAA